MSMFTGVYEEKSNPLRTQISPTDNTIKKNETINKRPKFFFLTLTFTYHLLGSCIFIQAFSPWRMQKNSSACTDTDIWMFKALSERALHSHRKMLL